MNEKKSNPTSSIILIIALLAVITLVFYGITAVRNSINKAINPIQKINNELGTQVSDLLHPTPTVIPDPVTIIHEIKTIARLETIRYSVEKVITAEVNQGVFGPLFGDRLLFIAHGYVIAGIDMEKISEADLRLKDGVLHVRLPAAEVFTTTLDNEKSYVYDRETGLFTKGNPDLETAARQAAEKEILKAAEEDGILALAMQNAQVYLERLFKTLGYENVVFEVPNP
jgi:hypothetical protein